MTYDCRSNSLFLQCWKVVADNVLTMLRSFAQSPGDSPTSSVLQLSYGLLRQRHISNNRKMLDFLPIMPRQLGTIFVYRTIIYFYRIISKS